MIDRSLDHGRAVDAVDAVATGGVQVGRVRGKVHGTTLQQFLWFIP